MRHARLAAALAVPMAASCNMDSSPAVENATPGLRETGTDLVPARQAIQRADLSATDLGTMNDAEVARVIAPGPHCTFTYVSGGKPVLVAVPGGNGPARGYVKLHGSLVELAAAATNLSSVAKGAVFRSDGIAVAVNPHDPSAGAEAAREADLVFQLEQGLRVGYGGFYSCAEQGLPRAR